MIKMQGRERLGLTRYIPERKKWARKRFNFSFKWFLKFAVRLKSSQNNCRWTKHTLSEFCFEFLLCLRWFNIVLLVVYQKLKMIRFLQPFTKYLRLILVSMRNIALRKKFNFCFSTDFCYYLHNFRFGREIGH